MKKFTKRSIIASIKTWLFIVLGLFVYSFGWSAFLIPAKLTGGGVVGLATILHYAFPVYLDVGWVNLVINAVLIIIAFRILGFRFVIKTAICILIVSIFFHFMVPLFDKPLIDDSLLSVTFFGGGLSALGIGLAISNGGNSGGTDIIVFLVGKFKNISYGKTSLMINVLVIASLYLVSQDIKTLLYSYLNMIIATTLSDYVIGSFGQSYQIMVFSAKNNIIAERINSEIKRGVTIINGYGWYTKHEQDVLITMTHRVEKFAVMRIIKQEDPNAFVSISKIQGVYGKNFDEIKIKTKKNIK